MKTIITGGTIELRSLQQRFMAEGLVIAAIIHCVIIGSYQLYSIFTTGKPIIPYNIPNDGHIICIFPPTISGTQVIPNIHPLGTRHSNFGNPIPVPDAELNPENEFTAPTDTPGGTGNETSTETGTGTIIGNGTVLNGDEAPPKEFIPGIEKYPVGISCPAPLFPEIARRAGIEGTVYVKMWVTKEGKVKTAEIVKSSADIFNQASVDAALSWTFTPAIMNTGPVSVWVTVPFRFRLHTE